MHGFIQSDPDPIVDGEDVIDGLPTFEADNKLYRAQMLANLHGELDDCRDLIRIQQSRISQLTNSIESMRTHNKDKHATIQSLRNDLDEMVRTHTIPSDEWMAKMFRID